MKNASGFTEGFSVYGICRKNPPYSVHVVRGSEVPNQAGTQAVVTAQCEAGNVPLSGGGFSTLHANTINASKAINMSSSFPQGQGWSSAENNTSTRARTAAATVICSGPYPPT